MSFFDPSKVPSPSYVVDLQLLERNLGILEQVKVRSGAHVLLALKAFSMFSVFPQIAARLDGICASSPDEARLGREEFGKEVHSYCPAYTEASLQEFLTHSDHLVFNNQRQLQRLLPFIPEHVSIGLRLNPQQQEAEVEIYDPSAPCSRLGTIRDEFDPDLLERIDGFHVHNLCEQDSDSLVRTWEAIERKFGPWLPQMKWINLGGGHHITRADYHVEPLIELVQRIREDYDVEVYLEPGEAVALNTGYFVSTVIDTLHNHMDLAILDSSASCHLPDVLEMPYRPGIIGAGKPGDYPHTYRLGGLSCLAGDVIGDYSFPEPLQLGQRLVFTDMAHYTMVKTNTFNGVRLPSICTFDPKKDQYEVIRTFGYEDFKGRLS